MSNEDEKEKETSKGCSNDEILAILGHELGHWKLSHNLKNLCISQVNILQCSLVQENNALIFVCCMHISYFPSYRRSGALHCANPGLGISQVNQLQCPLVQENHDLVFFCCIH